MIIFQMIPMAAMHHKKTPKKNINNSKGANVMQLASAIFVTCFVIV
jgi:hypothetical protein